MLRSPARTGPAVLPARLTTKAITPRSPRYEEVRHTYASAGAPAVVIVARDAGDVSEAVQFAARWSMPLCVRSGGHGPSTNEGGIVIDLEHLRGVEVRDPDRQLVRVGAGARWGEVARALDPHDLALTSGDYGDVGVGGLATIGGIGLLARRQGLTIDRVRAVEVVLADGTLVRADADQHADLFWAVRGAGGAFGAATTFELQAEPIGALTSAAFTYQADDLAGLLERWADLVEASSREVTSFLYVEAGTQTTGPVARTTVVHAGSDVDCGPGALAPFAELGAVIDQHVSHTRYAALLTSSRRPHEAQASGYTTRSGLLDHITPQGAAAIAELVTAGAAGIVQLRSIGGAVNDVAPHSTAYAHRRQNFSLVAATSRQRRDRLDAAWDGGIARHVRGIYLNLEMDRDESVLRRAYPPRTLARLAQLKRRYDPAGVFDHNLPIPLSRIRAHR